MKKISAVKANRKTTKSFIASLCMSHDIVKIIGRSDQTSGNNITALANSCMTSFLTAYAEWKQ